jgi:formylglycine-generating enzyme required for sulfatase activity
VDVERVVDKPVASEPIDVEFDPLPKRGIMRTRIFWAAVLVAAVVLVPGALWLNAVPDAPPRMAQPQADAPSFFGLPDARTAPASAPAPVLQDASQLVDFALFKDCADCPDMIVLPSGKFRMGAASDGLGGSNGEEQPVHQVTIATRFAIGRLEVTRAEYARFAVAIRASADSSWVARRGADYRSPGFEQTDRHPAVCTTWLDARDFARWLASKTGHAYRLPSEAEWEYAARGGTTTQYPWGDQLAPNKLNATDSADGFVWTAPVGSFPANKFGLFDVIGNVAEYTADRACLFSSTPTDSLPVQICGPGQQSWWIGEGRVVRGSWWGEEGYRPRVAHRSATEESNASTQVGIRVARDL